MAKDVLQNLADELEDVMDKRTTLEGELTLIKEYEDQVREKIVKGLLKKGFKYIKTTSGLGFGITNGRVTFKVKKGMEAEALEWAKNNYPGLLTLASAKLNQVVKPMLEPPSFLERVEGEAFLSVRATED